MSTDIATTPSIAERLGTNTPARRVARIRRWLFWGCLVVGLAVAVTRWGVNSVSLGPQCVTTPVTRGDLQLDAQRAAMKRADADVASAAATVSQAEAALDAFNADLSKMVIRAPINGVVLTRSIDPGQSDVL